MSVGKYNSSVRVGNWNEDLCLEEDLLKDFMDKKENGLLLVSKRRSLTSKLLQPVELTQNEDQTVRFGDVICLYNISTNQNLSISMSENQLLESDIVTCSVSASPILEPCLRNAFVVASYDGRNRNGDCLCYGQHFVLSAVPNLKNLMLTSNPVTFIKCSKRSPYQEVFMTSSSSYLCNWQVLHLDPQKRLQTEGYPILANKKIIIKHCYTNQALAALSDYTLSHPLHKKLHVKNLQWNHSMSIPILQNNFTILSVRTAFGREHEVAAHTFLDSHKAEKPENHWVIVAFQANASK